MKEQAAEALKLTAEDMMKNRLIDGVIAEPIGGAHRNPELIFETVKEEIKIRFEALDMLSAEERVNQRIAKFSAMGEVSK